MTKQRDHIDQISQQWKENHSELDNGLLIPISPHATAIFKVTLPPINLCVKYLYVEIKWNHT